MTTEGSPSLEAALADIRAAKKTLALARHLPGQAFNPKRRARRAIAAALGVSPKKARKVVKAHRRAETAEVARLRAQGACPKCGYAFDVVALGVHGCPNCHGEGLA